MTEIDVSRACQVLLHTDSVRVTLFPGRGSDIVFVVPSKNPKLHKPSDLATPPFPGLMRQGELSFVVIEDLKWNWISTPGDRSAIVATIQAALGPKQGERLGFGFSAGATNILDFCADLELDRVLAIGPQMDLGPAYAAFDPRSGAWADWLAPNAEVPNPASAFETNADLVILHGMRGADAGHAALCPGGEKVHHFLFPDQDHLITERVQQAGGISGLFKQLIRNEMDSLFSALQRAGAIQRGSLNQHTPEKPWGMHPASLETKSLSEQGLTTGDVQGRKEK